MPARKKNYIKLIKNKVGNKFSILKIYNNTNHSRDKNIKIRHNNKKCGYNTFIKTIRSFLSKPICPVCDGYKENRYTVQKQFPNFKILSFKDKHHLMTIKCNNSHIFRKSYYSFKHYTHCPKCIWNQKIKTFDKKLKQLTDNQYIRIGRFNGIDNKALILHKKCGYKWYVTPIHIFEGYRCPLCQHSLSIKQSFPLYFKKYFSKKWSLISKISTDHSPIIIRCKTCRHLRKITPHNLLEQGCICQYCHGSKGEIITYKYLKSYNIDNIIHSDILNTHSIPTIKGNLHLDFYLPTFQIGIEYDGYQHFKPIKFFGGIKRFKQQRWNDLIKDYWCKDHNIKLIRIENKYNYNSLHQIKQLIKNTLDNKLLPLINTTKKSISGY